VEDLREGFIVSRGTVADDLGQMIQKAKKYGVVEEEGKVVITNQRLTNEERCVLAAALRFLAHKVETGIQSEITLGEVAEFARIEPKQAAARMADAAAAGMINWVGKGRYAANAYNLKKFLDQLEKKYGGGNNDG
jgi:hypothetical protein